MKINADLPFAFCADCSVRDLKVQNLYAGSLVAESFITCEHARNCKTAVKLYQERMETGRQVYADD